MVPRGDGSPEDDYPTRIQAAVFGYVRGQLLFSLIMGTSAGVLLWILGSLGIFPEGKTYAFVFGAFYGFAELIPYVGPGGRRVPAGDDRAVQRRAARRAVARRSRSPRCSRSRATSSRPTVFSQALRINPLLVIFALLLGGQLYGFLGAFIALPIAAILRETTVYLRRHVRIEPWDLPAVAPAGTSFGGEPPIGAPDGGRAGAVAAASARAAAWREQTPPPTRRPTRAQLAEPRPPRERRRRGATSAPAGRRSALPRVRRRPPPGADVCPECGTELGDADETASATASAPQ